MNIIHKLLLVVVSVTVIANVPPVFAVSQPSVAQIIKESISTDMSSVPEQMTTQAFSNNNKNKLGSGLKETGENAVTINNYAKLSIKGHNNGFAYLVAPGVENEQVINAHLANVFLQGSSQRTIDFYGDQLIQFVDSTTGRTVNNGEVAFTPYAAEGVIMHSVNQKNIRETHTVYSQGKVIFLDQTDVSNASHANHVVLGLKKYKLDVAANTNTLDNFNNQTSAILLNSDQATGFNQYAQLYPLRSRKIALS